MSDIDNATISVVDAVLGCMNALDPVHELEGNRGYFVDAINAFAGSPLGSSWCLNVCHYAGAKVLGRKRWPLEIQGNCDDLMIEAGRKKILHDKPQRGDIFLKLDPNNRADATHAGFVDGLLDDGRFRTQEGNSNDNGSREGTDVVSIVRPRKAGEVYVFVDWAALVV